jgi:hypothetical protein
MIKKVAAFWNMTQYLIHAHDALDERTVSDFRVTLNLEDEAAYSSETSANIYHTTLRHIQDDSNLPNYCRQNLKPQKYNESATKRFR